MSDKMKSVIFDKVERHLLMDRNSQVMKVMGIGQRDIGNQLIADLYSLPGSGGSDEREFAKEWFFRSIALFGRRGDSFKTWEEMKPVIGSFDVPTLMEMEQLASRLDLGRSR
jgi:hypothetical protein